MKRRDLTPEEEVLWDKVTHADKPLPERKRKRVTEEKKKEKPLVPRSHAPLPMPKIREASTQPLIAGSTANIDRNTADRFRKGELPLDATLDLHGMNRESAYNALMKWIKNQYERGNRCLLVITGKGVKKTPDGDDRGVLRELLPQWLELSDVRPMILAFSAAKPRHGGSGAFYVLLRRRR